ncbi:hypothetical protein EH55_06795, partial [Synergistes jonesii]
SVPQSRYELKLRIIENCVYGVDIQPIAMLICKLRFFISMICEQTEINFEDKEHNFGVNPLPNLETKFVAANSLINIKKKSRQSGLFEDPDINKTKLMLMALRHEHFYARSTYKKQKLRDEDECLRQKLADLLEANGEFAPEDARLFAGWNPYDQNAVSPFFDPEWMFGVKDGFDIVIGNPPYIQLQNNGGELGEKYEPHNFETFVRTGDIYSLFYEKGGQLLKQGGHLCFITSNKWMRAGYGEKTRKFLFEKTNPLQLIDFAGVKIFESATVDTNILLFEKAANKNNTLCCVTKNMTKRGLTNLSLFVQQHAFACPFTTSDSWVILSPIEQSIKRKIEVAGTPLKDWNIQINYGIKTGFNDAFIISTAKRDEILANCQTEDERKRTEEIIRPILRGRDIKRYSYDWAGLWLINTHNGVKENGQVKIPRIKIDDYPTLRSHFDKYGERLVHRADQGDTPYNLRNCAYLEDFLKPKIIYPNMTKYLPFVYDSKGFITNQKCFIVTGLYTAFLTAFFNSSLFKFCFRDSFPELQGETRELSKIFFDKIPVPIPNEKIGMQFEVLVSDIQKEYTKQKAINIDQLLFDLYKLTQEERQAIGFVEID